MLECQKSHLTLTGAGYICSALCSECHPASIQYLEEWLIDLGSSQLGIEFHHSPPWKQVCVIPPFPVCALLVWYLGTTTTAISLRWYVRWT